MLSRFIFCTLGALFVGTAALTAQSDPESFHVEVTGSAWILNASGTLQASGTPVDLKSDLGVNQNQPTFLGKLVIKPGRKHRIVIEGTPFRLDGVNTITRTITYHGQTFNVSDTVASSAQLDYLFAGYQYDVISRSSGHLGFAIGGAYLNATGTLRSQQLNTVASNSQTIGLPLVGADFRIFPLPSHKLLEISGAAKGMAFGDYGHYVDGQINVGVPIGALTVEAGYRIVDADLHQTSGQRNGVSPQFTGPVFSLVFRH
jgi:hypothetical protein